MLILGNTMDADDIGGSTSAFPKDLGILPHHASASPLYGLWPLFPTVSQ